MDLAGQAVLAPEERPATGRRVAALLPFFLSLVAHIGAALDAGLVGRDGRLHVDVEARQVLGRPVDVGRLVGGELLVERRVARLVLLERRAVVGVVSHDPIVVRCGVAR